MCCAVWAAGDEREREREERIRARLPNFRSLSLFNEYVACCSVVVVVTFLVVLAGLPAVTVQQDAPILIHNNRERKKTTKQREELYSAYIYALVRSRTIADAWALTNALWPGQL